MSSIIKQKVGNKIYLYESVSYRNTDGKPRNKRTPIGKIDSVTGDPIYKPEYLVRMIENGTPVDIPATNMKFSIDDIRNSSIKQYGSFHLFKNIAESTGLTSSMENSIPKYWQEIFTLACYLISSGDPFLYCEDWIHSTECLSVGNMSSQRISELLIAITPKERETFYQNWCKCRSEQEYLALDITSMSSYSTLIEDVEWGYNRDKEQLPQINLCMLMGEKSRLPIYQTVYSGSLKDVSTLKTTLSKMDAISKGKPKLIVMDKGFFSTKNINDMLEDADNSRFIIAVPFTSGFAKKQVESERKDIDCLQNTIVIGGESIRGITKLRAWNTKHKLYVHVYYNAMKAMNIREEMYAHVTVLKKMAETDPTSAKYADEYQKYLLIRSSEKNNSGYTVNIREDVINKKLDTAGWMVIISNDISDAREALTIYREKDVVEKGFLRVKKSLDLGRLRVHREESMQNKVFVGFVALILLSQIHRVMLAKGLYKKMTMKKLLLTLSKLRIQEINGTRILFPLTKEQKNIYKAFDIDEPVGIKF
ncbi:MAG: IS1634 family transposase [Clostridia bacterium]|nr:IS1634 family transposase [Clostridia bacterium]